MLKVLLAEKNSSEIVAEEFLEVVSRTSHKRIEYQCKQVFQVWKESTQTPTYRSLRSVLDKVQCVLWQKPTGECVVCVLLFVTSFTRLFMVCAISHWILKNLCAYMNVFIRTCKLLSSAVLHCMWVRFFPWISVNICSSYCGVSQVLNVECTCTPTLPLPGPPATHLYTHTRTHTHAHTRTHMHTRYKHTHTRTTHTQSHTVTHTLSHMHTHTACTCTHAYRSPQESTISTSLALHFHCAPVAR